ncbi:hypothetical protein [uncultured Eubacterium sp.]|uniref:hypothetical protein n=1 Tax=uncultured Eubacterium sp. TaxID=165185 RepID=UPI002593FDDB|nr:hypothetical protein [uncultured Eubacterium sp.]
MGCVIPYGAITSAAIAEMHRRICHALHDVHLAARIPWAFLNDIEEANEGEQE